MPFSSHIKSAVCTVAEEVVGCACDINNLIAAPDLDAAGAAGVMDIFNDPRSREGKINARAREGSLHVCQWGIRG